MCHGVGSEGLGSVGVSRSYGGGLRGDGAGTSTWCRPTLALPLLLCVPLWPCRVCERAQPLPPPPLQQSSHTHTTPVLSRLLWDATAAQLSLPPSLQCWHTLPLSIAHIHFPCSIFMLPSTLVSLFHCAEEKKVNNGELTGIPYFLLGCIFPFSALSFCEIASSPPPQTPHQQRLKRDELTVSWGIA